MPNEQPVLLAAPLHERPGVAVAARLVDAAARVERVEEDAREAVKDLQTRGPYGHRVGWVDLDVGGSHGLGTVATFCSSRMVEHPKSQSTHRGHSQMTSDKFLRFWTPPPWSVQNPRNLPSFDQESTPPPPHR